MPGTYDQITGVETGASTTYASIIGLFTKIATDYALTNEMQSGDRMAIIGPQVAPQLTDKLMVGASVLTIVNIVPVNPAGTAVAYKLQVRGVVTDVPAGISQRLRVVVASLSLDGQPVSLATDARSTVGRGSLALTGLPLSAQIGDRYDVALNVLASSLHLSGVACAVQTGTVVSTIPSVGAGHSSIVSRPSQASAGMVAQAIASALAATGQQVAVQLGNSISMNASMKIGSVGLSRMAVTVTATTHIDAITSIGTDVVQHTGEPAAVAAGSVLDMGTAAYETPGAALSITTSSNAGVVATIGAGSLLTTAKALNSTTTGVDGTATMTTSPTATVSDTTARIAFRVSGRSA